MSTTVPTTRPARQPTTARPPKTYLLIYNALSLTLWASILLTLLLPALLTLTPTTLPASPTTLPRIRWTQTLALLEVLHAALGLVRANAGTTAMQVSSRLLLVWGVVYAFGEGGAGGHGRAWEGMGVGVGGARAAGGAGLFAGGGAAARELQMVGGDTAAWAYAGMLLAWCCSEVVRYGYFVVVLAGGEGRVPGWLLWLRYNAFFALYPLGISCECLLVYASLGLARAWAPLYAWFLVAALAVYVPGSYILYSHMMTQRRRIMRGKARKA